MTCEKYRHEEFLEVIYSSITFSLVDFRSTIRFPALVPQTRRNLIRSLHVSNMTRYQLVENWESICCALSQMRGLEELHINFYAFPRGSSSEEMLLTPLTKIEGVERVVVGLPLPEIMHPLEELV